MMMHGKSGGMKMDMKSDGKAMDMKSGGMKMGQMDHSAHTMVSSTDIESLQYVESHRLPLCSKMLLFENCILN
jgi:hypothetical protein